MWVHTHTHTDTQASKCKHSNHGYSRHCLATEPVANLLTYCTYLFVTQHCRSFSFALLSLSCVISVLRDSNPVGQLVLCVLLLHLWWFLIAEMQSQSFCQCLFHYTVFSLLSLYVGVCCCTWPACSCLSLWTIEKHRKEKENILSYPSLVLPHLMLGHLLKSTFVFPSCHIWKLPLATVLQ